MNFLRLESQVRPTCIIILVKPKGKGIEAELKSQHLAIVPDSHGFECLVPCQGVCSIQIASPSTQRFDRPKQGSKELQASTSRSSHGEPGRNMNNEESPVLVAQKKGCWLR